MKIIALWVGLVTFVAAAPQRTTPAAAKWAARAGADLPTQGRAPLNLGQVRELVGLLPDNALAAEIAERGISFTASEEIVAELQRIGAGARTVAALRILIPNRPPSVVLSLGAKEVWRGESVACFAEASDPEGGEVSFEWSASDGTIEGEGPSVSLNTAALGDAAESSSVVVNVTVRDARGGYDTATQAVRVRRRRAKPRPPPLRVAIEGKYLLVYVAPAAQAGPSGSVAVYLNAPDIGAGPGNLVGGLPGRPCRVTFEPVENVAEVSLKEPPGVGNGWGVLVARVRPKNPRRSVRFMVNWSILEDRPD